MERPDFQIVGTFFVPSLEDARGEKSLGPEVAHHLRVRRVAPGERLRLTDGRGRVVHGTLSALEKHNGRVMVEQVDDLPAPLSLHLLAPIADRDRTLWLAEKAVELGITCWTPVRWQRSRSVASRGEGDAFRAKLRGRMIAALEQSGGSWLPVVEEEIAPEAVAASLEHAVAGERLLLEPKGAPLLTVAGATEAVALAIGPEGGFETSEVALLQRDGFRSASLGSSTLRFETAAVAALALVVALRTAGASRHASRSLA